MAGMVNILAAWCSIYIYSSLTIKAFSAILSATELPDGPHL